MTTKEKIAVMQAFDDGKQIQTTHRACSGWYDVDNPTWDWCCYTYRVKPEPRKPREWWVNVYVTQAGYAWESKEKADALMCKNRIECVHVREVMEDGQ